MLLASYFDSSSVANRISHIALERLSNFLGTSFRHFNASSVASLLMSNNLRVFTSVVKTSGIVIHSLNVIQVLFFHFVDRIHFSGPIGRSDWWIWTRCLSLGNNWVETLDYCGRGLNKARRYEVRYRKVTTDNTKYYNTEQKAEQESQLQM